MFCLYRYDVPGQYSSAKQPSSNGPGGGAGCRGGGSTHTAAGDDGSGLGASGDGARDDAGLCRRRVQVQIPQGVTEGMMRTREDSSRCFKDPVKG